MSKEIQTICLPPNYTIDVYNNQTNNWNHWTIQEMWNIPSKNHFDAMTVKVGEIDMFLRLLDEDVVIQEFLKNDICSQLADKYLLAMVFTYFKRAQYTPQEFTRYNFFVALFLAHDIEEDDEDIKYELYIWALGFHWQQHFQEMIASREVLWKAIGYRGIVSRTCCEKVISLRPNHAIWQRTRAEIHAGAIRPYDAAYKAVCCNCCKLKSAIEINDSGIFESSDETDSISSDQSAGKVEAILSVYNKPRLTIH